MLILTIMISINAQENLYILGNVGDQQWDPSIGTQMEYIDGLYMYEGFFYSNSYFSFTTQLAENSNDWDAIAPFRFGAPSEGYLIN